MTEPELLQRLLLRFHEEGVEYVLIGGQAVRLNGFERATEDVDVLLRASEENGRRVIRALDFLPSSKDLDPAWFAPSPSGEVENIRVADSLLVDLLFAANGETYESMRPYMRELALENGTRVKVLGIDGLLKTKTDYRAKDLIDKQALLELKRRIAAEGQG